MKRIIFTALVAAGLTGLADVYSDVHLWMRGVVRDANGDGLAQAGEFFNSVSNACLPNVDIINAPEVGSGAIRWPMGAVTRTSPYLRLSQTPVITNETAGTGYVKPQSVRLRGVLAGYDDHYSFVFRFRADVGDPMQQDWSWLVNFGYGKDKGLMVGLSGRKPGERTLRAFTYEKDYLAPNYFSISNGFWYDVGVAVDGTKVTMLVSGHGPNSDYAPYFQTRSYTRDVTEHIGTFAPGGQDLVLGAESPHGGTLAYSTDITQNSGNAYKSFRGDLQHFALWRRALSYEELREALSWPRLDAARLGVENDSAAEFSGEAAEGGAEPEGQRWDFPRSFAPGTEAKIRIVREAGADDALPQLLRWKSTSSSGTGQLRLTVNGTVLGTKTVLPGRYAHWYVPAACFTAGADNVAVLRRVDAGAQPVVPDAVVLGGSWQIGRDDGSHIEFLHESGAGTEAWAQDGNWQNLKRALLGTVTWNQQITNQTIRFSLPADLAGRYAGRLSWRALGNLGPDTHMTVTYDGAEKMRVVGPEARTVYGIDLAPEDLAAGEHAFDIRNGEGTVDRYFSPDYYRFELLPRADGTIMFVR